MPASMQVPQLCRATLRQAGQQSHCVGEDDALQDVSPGSQSQHGQVYTPNDVFRQVGSSCEGQP